MLDVRDLLGRARDGDRDARLELVRLLADEQRLHSSLQAIVRRLMPGHHPARRIVDSRDVMQSALKTALDQLPRFRGADEASLFGWLRAIVRTKVQRALRKVERERESDVTAVPADVDPDRVVTDDLVEALRHAIQDLPIDQRLVVELRLRGLNSSQIAGELGLKPATVRKREQRAVGVLRERLDPPSSSN